MCKLWYARTNNRARKQTAAGDRASLPKNYCKPGWCAASLWRWLRLSRTCALGSAAVFSARTSRPVTLLTHVVIPALHLEGGAVTAAHLVVPAFGQLHQNVVQATTRLRGGGPVTAASGSCSSVNREQGSPCYYKEVRVTRRKYALLQGSPCYYNEDRITTTQVFITTRKSLLLQGSPY